MPRKTKIVTRSRVWLTFVGILVLAIFAGLIDYPKLPADFPGQSWFSKFTPKLGLDLQGGAHLVYQADVSDIPSADAASALEGVRDVIEQRVNAFGVSEPLVQTGSNNRLIIELAGVTDVNQAIQQIGETPLLEFKEMSEPPAPTPLTAAEKEAAVKHNEETLNTADSIIQQLNQGSDFGELARQYSEDPGSKDNGGDLDFAKRNTFVPEFEEVLFDQLKISEITQAPLKTEFGYHIIKKLDERGQGEDYEVKGAHILLTITNEVYQSQDNLTLDWNNTQLSGKNLKRSAVEFDPNSGQPVISLQFDDQGRELFAAITKRNLQKPVAIFLDGQPISIPTVQEEITQGSAVISGNFNLVEAKLLAQRLNAGALPVPIELISQQTVGPALGKISLQKSLIAGFLGLIIVSLFMIIFYRLPGLMAVVALFIYGLVALAIFELWPVTLTLAGIAGFILSVGMAVDANVLIFERTKEELRNGKPIGTSVEEGFNRAWFSIRDSNFSSIITCVILAWFGSSLIKGFAVTLAIGILISMFSAITVTRTFLRLMAAKYFEDHPFLFGVSKKKDV
ncbi:MAG TPA: protein translocase subunit SecD [Candidatus Komeilibacteria bacterium]|nr:MAG: Protein translocase subunit SecD [Parcubacteria group bacterium GW2011_GWF2_45_11]KKT97709.1 MAG: Protein translocase subunit SecD [Parcubacteria group bacterium GW2011_GWC2_45_15]HBV02366.1 protein translocase subunit SecD [Candidatus Komeilibacteria bacterium]